MKKWISILGVLALSLSLVACSVHKENNQGSVNAPVPSVTDDEHGDNTPGGTSEQTPADPSAEDPDEDEFEGLDVEDEVVIELGDSEGVGGL